jgi:hypothetical protein
MFRGLNNMEKIQMKYDIPTWAMQRVNLMDHSFLDVKLLQGQERTQIQLPDLKKLKSWAKFHHWPTPWFGFKDKFIARVFESEDCFKLALKESGIIIHIPIKQHTVSIARLKKLDAMYNARADMGGVGQRPTDWGALVSELREMRGLIEAGVEVKIVECQTILNSWQSFYTWAHGRYHLLEDGCDSWIGNDD